MTLKIRRKSERNKSGLPSASLLVSLGNAAVEIAVPIRIVGAAERVYALFQ